MIIGNIMRNIAGWWQRREEKNRQEQLAAKPLSNPGLVAAVKAQIVEPAKTSHGGPSRPKPHWLRRWHRRNHRNARRIMRRAT